MPGTFCPFTKGNCNHSCIFLKTANNQEQCQLLLSVEIINDYVCDLGNIDTKVGEIKSKLDDIN